jgi:hypothetical protein
MKFNKKILLSNFFVLTRRKRLRCASTISSAQLNHQEFNRGVSVVNPFFPEYLQFGLPGAANTIVSVCQENIDFNTLFRYKKASTEKEEAC